MQSILYPGGIPLWRNVVFIQWVVQIISAIVVIAIVSGFIFNVANEIQDREIPFGFSFLDEAAQIPIGESVIEYDPSESYLYGFTVAALNTVKASVLGVVLATTLGIIIGVSRLSSNWLLSRLALVYIETFRNIPLLIQLLFWFLIILELPNVREGYVFFDAFYLNNSGFYMPWTTPLSGFWPWAILTFIGIGVGILAFNYLQKREIETGQPSYPIIAGFVIFVVVTIIGLIIFTPLELVVPERQEGPFGRLAGRCSMVRQLLRSTYRTRRIHLRIHRRDRPRRYPSRQPRTDRSCTIPRPQHQQLSTFRHLPTGFTRHYPAANQPVPEPHQELIACRRHWIPRPRQRIHHHDPDRPRNLPHRHGHGHIPRDEPLLLPCRKHLQPDHQIRRCRIATHP